MTLPEEGDQPGLLGRRAVRRKLTSLLDTARRDHTRRVLLRGDAGSGRSRLLDHLADEAGDEFLVLRTRGLDSDREIAHAGLLSLLRPVESDLDVLAGDLGASIRGALALGGRSTTSRSVRLGVMRILAELAQERPVLVLVDDADLLDHATTDVLAFGLGRLHADAVAAVLTLGSEASTPIAADDEIRLEPLGDADIATIVRAQGALADQVVARCTELACGNPLAAIELVQSLTADERAGRTVMPRLPRTSSATARGFAARLAGVPESTRWALAVVAADDGGELDVVLAALARLGESPKVLTPAERAGLVEIRGGRISLRHPLLRPVAYHQVAAASRRAVHRALAQALVRPDQAVRRAWQLAAACYGVDDTAADALALVARHEEALGAPGSAARAWRRAATLTDSPARRSDRLLRAFDRWCEALDFAAAAGALEELAALPPSFSGSSIGATVLSWSDGPGAAAASLVVAADGGPDSVAPALRALAAEQTLLGGDRVGAVALAERAAEEDPTVAPFAETLMVRAGARPARSLLDAPPIESQRSPIQQRALLSAATALLDAGWDAAAEQVLTALFSRPRLTGPDAIEAEVLRARLLLQRGDLAGAYQLLSNRRDLLPPAGHGLRDTVDVALAAVELQLGRLDAAGRVVDVVERGGVAGRAPLLAEASAVRGTRCMAQGDLAGACAAFDVAARIMPHRFVADHVVALALAGSDETAAWSGDVEALSEHLDPFVSSRAWRARGALDRDPGSFDRAHDALSGIQAPLETAEIDVVRTELAVRGGDLAAAHRSAERARAVLEPIGGAPGRLRIERALPAEGTGPRSHLADQLSPAEYRVAVAVGGGLTNREAADHLYLSIKTVDFHLQSIYRKLDIRSRTQLAVLMSREPAPDGEEPS